MQKTNSITQDSRTKIFSDGLIFDVDGTLWDSTPVVADAWNKDLRELNAKRKTAGETPLIPHHPKNGGHGPLLEADDLRREFGKPLSDIIADLLPDTDAGLRASLLQRWFISENDALEAHPPKPYAGLRQVWENFQSRNIPCFIVSNCQAGYIEAFLAATGLQAFIKDHLCPGDTNLYKADNIRIIVNRYHLQHAVYIGDIQADCDATRQASRDAENPVRFIWASYGFGHVDAPDAAIADIGELPAVIV